MERKFIIDKKELVVSQDQIKMYYKIYDDCYQNHKEVLQQYENALYVSDDGKVIDCQDCAKAINEHVYSEEGLVIEVHDDYFTLEKAEGFILNNKLYLIDMLEEVQ